MSQERSKAENRKRIIVQATAGSAASITQHLLHPFDLIKVRFQSHDSGKAENNVIPKYATLRESFLKIYREEGFRGFYKGMGITLVASNIAYGLSMALYEVAKQRIRGNFDSEIYADLVAFSISSSFATFIMQPLFVLKTRRLLDVKEGLGAKRVWQLATEVRNHHGLLGFFRGYSLSLLLALHGVSQMTTYKYLKYKLDKIYGENQAPNYLIAGGGAVSRLFTSIFLHPLATVRTRFQQNQYVQADLLNQKYIGIQDIIKKTYHNEGLKGFYKGIIPLTLRTLPSHSLFFLAYENTKNFMTKYLEIENIK